MTLTTQVRQRHKYDNITSAATSQVRQHRQASRERHAVVNNSATAADPQNKIKILQFPQSS